MKLNIGLATSDYEIMKCFPVMMELRMDLIESDFLALIRKLQKSGFQMAFITENENVVAVAGFRIGQSLAWKNYLYVEDLVTSASVRSKGYGAALLNWLTEFAIKAGCVQFHLDSGIQRRDAHRFYEREGMQCSSYHFAKYIMEALPGS